MGGEKYVEPATELQAQSGSFVPRLPFDSFGGLVRHITAAGLSGLIAGVLVGGIGGRLFMRIAGAIASDIAQGRSTEAGFRVGEVTFGGSIELIVFLGIFSGLFGAVFYVALFPWLSSAGRWRGLAFGVTLFGAVSATSDLMNPDNIDFFILKNEPILVGLMIILVVGFGLVLDASYRVIDRRLPVPDNDVNLVYYLLSAVGLIFVGFAGLALFSDPCSCDPPRGVAWSMVVVVAGTAALWLSVLLTSPPKWLGRASTVVGYLGTAGVLVFGLIRAFSDAADIIR
jgi:MFS family permease